MRSCGPLPGGRLDVIGILDDIDAEHAAVEQAAHTDKLTLLGGMATGLAHELNQPLAIMSFAAQNAKTLAGDANPALTTRLDRIVAQARRASAIIDTVRNFAGQDNGKLEALGLAPVVKGALHLALYAPGMEEIEVHLDLPANLPPVLARRAGLEQVLLNVLGNARDALLAKPGGPKQIGIAACADPVEGFVHLRISDTGGGIPADVLPHIFEPFFTTKAGSQGTGMGLAICDSLMHAFGGSITAANVAGGAEFTLAFPMAPAGQMTEPEPQAQHSG